MAPRCGAGGGPRVGTGGLLPLAAIRPAASFSLDVDQPLALVPAYGMGWFGPPALRAHRGGIAFAQRFDHAEIKAESDRILVRLLDAVAGIAIDQRLVLTGDCLTMSATITNIGDTPLDLDWLAAGTVPLPADCAAIHGFTGRHNAELRPAVEPMPAHGCMRENRRGLTGHAGPPGLFVAGPGATRHAGRVYAAQLAWSGNHRIAIERDDDGFWALMLGEALAPGEIRLAPGASYGTPEMLATCSLAGLNGASQQFHAAIRARAPWPAGGMTPRNVHLNSWEGFYFDHDEARLKALATRAAALGVERFVLDDGWFANRHDDSAALGDWTTDRTKYPDGPGAAGRSCRCARHGVRPVGGAGDDQPGQRSVPRPPGLGAATRRPPANHLAPPTGARSRPGSRARSSVYGDRSAVARFAHRLSEVGS